IPIGAILMTIITYRVFAPNVYYYAIRMPGSWPIRWNRAWEGVTQGIVSDPLFIVALVVALLRPQVLRDERSIWLLAAVMLSIPCTALFYAKAGGSYNS